jgi:signal transduction histidine kinase
MKLERGVQRGALATAKDKLDAARGELNVLRIANADAIEVGENERTKREESERMGRMKDEFLSNLSHEIRTPLNAIIGWSELLVPGETSKEEMIHGLEVITRNARAQARLIDDLLDMSRVVSGKLRLDVRPVNLPALIGAAIDTVNPAAVAKSMSLTKVIDPIACPVTGDSDRLHQVIWNLLVNAIKFTPTGGSIVVALKRVNSCAELSVSDNGKGISADFLPWVFDRFRQADSSLEKGYSGLGLGLSIVKSLVELHGGSVRVNSDGEGKGTTFIVSLPISAVEGK